ncbi:hypothetical protein OBBRIDRAFT_821763 [Obba rivulosa]|uniref:Uncharacterized protein n=1 Tax=Obba rivulosa TaxID=1052685 RepID=A0A8E2AMY6_9APHY|nr:hypothetical protein OBBRIDRAFT_821763 [Obba rivulosa]
MTDFSWSDGLQAALASCLPCLQSRLNDEHDADYPDAPQHGRTALHHTAPPPRARPDELEGLLADADDAETLSLHSNLGDDRRRRRRRAPRRGVRFFGFDLFGRPPIHLPESDDEDEDADRRRAHRSRTVSTSSTLDSDAAPLDPAAIAQLSAAQLVAAAAKVEEERRKAKEERRKLRRERRELKKARLAMAMDLHQGDEHFEGFQGSGAVPYDFSPGPGTASGSGTLSVTDEGFMEDFGPFTQGAPHPPPDDDDADADFGAETYTRRTAHHTLVGAGTDSRGSRTSGSGSNSYSYPYPHPYPVDPAPYNHHYLSQPPTPVYATPPAGVPPREKRNKRGSRTHSVASHSTHSTSLRSPPPGLLTPGTALPPPGGVELVCGPEGGPGGAPGQELLQKEAPAAEGAFPSVGLRGVQRTKSDMGVFLARRGEL